MRSGLAGRALVCMLVLATTGGCASRLRHVEADGGGACEAGTALHCACDDGSLGVQYCVAGGIAGDCQCGPGDAPGACTISNGDAGAELRCPDGSAFALPTRGPEPPPNCHVVQVDAGPSRIECAEGAGYVVQMPTLAQVDAGALGPTLDGSYTVRNALDAELLSFFAEVEGDLTVDAPGLSAVQLPMLRRVGGGLRVMDHELTVLSLPALEVVGGPVHIEPGRHLSEVALPALRQAVSVDVDSRHWDSPVMLDLRTLETTEQLTLSFRASSPPRLDSLRTVVGALHLSIESTGALSLPLLERAGGLQMAVRVPEVHMPSLVEIGKALRLEVWDSPDEIALPALQRVGADVDVRQPPLRRLALPALRFAGAVRVTVYGQDRDGPFELDLSALVEAKGSVTLAVPDPSGVDVSRLQTVGTLALSANGGPHTVSLGALEQATGLTLSNMELLAPRLAGVTQVVLRCGRIAFPPASALQRLTLGGVECAQPGAISGVTHVESLTVSGDSVAPDLLSADTVQLWPMRSPAPSHPVPALREVTQEVVFGGNGAPRESGGPLDCAAALPALAGADYPNVRFKLLERTEAVDCSVLTRVAGVLELIDIREAAIDFSGLARIDGDLVIENFSAQPLLFPALETLGGMPIVNDYSLDFGAPLLGIPLRRVSKSAVTIDGPETLAAFQKDPPPLLTGPLTVTDTDLTALVLPGIRYLSGGLHVEDNPLLTSILLPDLRAVSELEITHNVSLTELSLEALNDVRSAKICDHDRLPACYATGVLALAEQPVPCADDAHNEGHSSCPGACCPGQ